MNKKKFDKLSYALGLSMGHNFRAMGMEKLSIQDFADGVASVFYGEAPKMTIDEAKAEVQAYLEQVQKKHHEQAMAMAELNAKAGKEFLEANGKRVEVQTLPSGLQYEVLEEGNGPKPATGDRVTVHYTGKLIDGTVFDSSEDRGEPATFGVTQVIPGWVEALQLMNAGSKWRLYIPSELAYGPNGAGGIIGPNQTLIFDVNLISVEGK